MDENGRPAEQMPHNIGRYQVQESIGFGAMGAVYKAFDPLIKRTLAIKTIRLDIPKQSPQYRSFIERFYHEARISGTLSHPNIVTLFDIGEEGGLPYLAMEFVEGETIASIVERGQKFKPEKVISLVSQIASAVDYAHSKGVIHRDIKPSNLILYEGERVKVTDFGIAKLVDAEMTQSGTLLGTPSYMSPEQAMGDKLDGRSDIFSLGVCAFEMLCGEQPFPGNNVTSILYKLVHVDPIEPANLEMNGLVPQKWHEVFGRVLAKKPDDRYQTATDFVQDLEYCLGAWFGAAMGDETIAEAGSVTAKITAAAVGKAVAAAPPPPEVEAPTKVMPSKAPAPAEETDLPATVHMKAPQVEKPPVPRPAEEKTVLMGAPPVQEREPAGTAADLGGVTQRYPVRTETPPRPTSPGQKPPPVPTGRPATPGRMGSAEPATVLMGAPLPPPRAKPAPSVPPPPRTGDEKTVLMGAVSAAAGSEPTVRAPVLPPPLPPPRPPQDDEWARSKDQETPPAEVAPARKGSRLGLILGGIGLVVLLLLASLGIAVYKKIAASLSPVTAPRATPTVSTQPATEPSPVETPPPAVTGTLHVETTPPGATVSVNGEARGVTPLDIADLAMGSYEVKLDLKGFVSGTQAVLLAPEAPQAEVKLTLSRTVPAVGGVDVVSNPPGAAVRIDGGQVGQTPLTDHKLKAGSHHVEVVKEGFEPWTGKVTIQGGRRAKVDAFLKAIPKPTATPPPADAVDITRIYVNTAQDVDTLAKKVSGTSASYPSNAPRLRSGDAVSVRVGFVVTETGEITDVKVLESAGKVLDEAVAGAVKTWKFSPAVKKGVKVKVRVEFRQTFRAG